MADWEYKPESRSYTVVYNGPIALVDRFEDQSLTIREKSTTIKREFIGEYIENETTSKAMYDLFDTKTLDTTLTILTFDPQAADPDTDEATCYFVEKSEARYVGPKLIRMRWHFREQ